SRRPPSSSARSSKARPSSACWCASSSTARPHPSRASRGGSPDSAWNALGEVVMFRWLVVLLGLSLLALCCARLAHAADDKHAEPSPFTGALDLTIWTWVVFLLLFFLLKKYAWGPMLTGLKQREDNIHLAMDEAKKARAEAEDLRVHLKKEMDQVNDKIRAMMEAAHRDGEATKAQLVAEAENEIRAERERSLREIGTARDQALQELWNRTAQLATEVSSRAIRRQLTEDDHRRLVDEALAELRQAA